MPINITMPALSPTMEEGNLAKWLVKEGDTVKSGDVIAEIETDKATMEVEAVDEGIVAKIVVPAGTEGVKVNARDRRSSPPRARMPAPPPSRRCRRGEGRRAQGRGAAGRSQGRRRASRLRRTLPAARPRPRLRRPHRPLQAGERVFASPLARRIAKEAGIDCRAVTGSGPHGRVVKADVEAAIAGGGAKARRAGGACRSAGCSCTAPPRQGACRTTRC